MSLISFIALINNFLWNGPLLVLLCAIHLFFTIKLKFPQRHTLRAIRLSVTSDNASPMPGTPNAASDTSASAGLSGFATLTATLAATLGTGNIVGISTAIAAGGPGALFWCWITGILGMATAYAECYLTLCFRQKKADGTLTGGPMYVLEKGLGSRILGKFYALCTLCAAFGVGCTTQVSAITDATYSLWQLPPLLVGIVVTLLGSLVILGGVKTIGNFCTKAVPLLGILYIFACLILLAMNFSHLTNAVTLMFQTAFSPKAVSGGLLGGSFLAAARYGIARGLFTNEAGIGTAALAAGSTKSVTPERQSLISMTAVFWDTVVMCALTGLVILTNLLKRPHSTSGFSKGGLTAAAFTAFPFGGNTFLTVTLIAFAITTLIGWCYLGEKGAEYLWGPKSIRAYRFCYLIMIFTGAILPMDFVWHITDLISGIMIFPNVLALVLLQHLIQTPSSVRHNT